MATRPRPVVQQDIGEPPLLRAGDVAVLAFWLALRGLLRPLPWSWAMALAEPLAAVGQRVPWGRLPARLRRHLQQVLGRREAERAVPSAFVHLVEQALLRARLPSLPDERLARHVQLEGLEHLCGALAQGRGAVLAGAHYGAPGFLAARALRQAGYPVTLVGPAPQPAMSRFYRRVLWPLRSEAREPLQPLVPDGTVQRALVAELRRNRVLLWGNDVPAPPADAEGSPFCVPVRLLGRRAYLRTGPLRAALLGKSPFLPVFVFRRGAGRFVVQVCAPLPTNPDGLASTTQAYAAQLEEVIAQDPGAWHVWTLPDLLQRMPAMPEPAVKRSALPPQGAPALGEEPP